MKYDATRYDHTCPGCQGCGAMPCGACDGIGQVEAVAPHIAEARMPAVQTRRMAEGRVGRQACSVCHGAGAMRCQLCHGKGIRGPVAASRFV